MNTYLLTMSGLLVAAVPFVLGVTVATWRQRRVMAARSRTLTVDLGPKVLLGVALSTGTAAPALASTNHAPVSAVLPHLDRVASLPSPKPMPSNFSTGEPTPPAATATPVSRPIKSGSESAAWLHVVRPGESLWSITRDHLGSAATNAAIAHAWPQIWAANRAVIGADPAVLFPGQRLQIPAQLGVAS
jgi:resuscitation-promoting factor RpfA